MSRRYGRNQKRAHRERIEALQAAMQMDRGLMTSMGRKLRDANEQIEQVHRVLGEHTALLPPKRMALPGPALDRINLRMVGPVNLTQHGMKDVWADPMRMLPLPVLLTRVKREGNPYEDAVHIKVTFGDGQVGYALSELAIQTTPTDVLVQEISRAVAERLVSELKARRSRVAQAA